MDDTPRPPTRHDGENRLLRWLTYRARLLLLELYGPADLDEGHNPIIALKREYGRPTHSTGPRA